MKYARTVEQVIAQAQLLGLYVLPGTEQVQENGAVLVDTYDRNSENDGGYVAWFPENGEFHVYSAGGNVPEFCYTWSGVPVIES